MSELILSATPRVHFGHQVKQVRRAGQTPIIAYAKGQEPMQLQTNEFTKFVRKLTKETIFTLEVAGKNHQVKLVEIDTDPVKGVYRHADLILV
jgi:large subunit ribosomal protein L25